MKLTIYLSDKGQLTINDFDMGSAMDMVEALESVSSGTFMTFEMDGSEVLVNRDHIVRIDVD